jgi:16S rRNA (adenine1518-N6/adenine1519-N6)-dimethyltransferase
MSLKDKLIQKQQALEFLHKRSLGQNFLINERVVARILEAVTSLLPSRSFDTWELIEIGPGLGSLTDELKSLHPHLLLVELDRRLAEFWRAQDLLVLEVDALKLNWFQRPKPFVIVSNLPYQIAASLMVELGLLPTSLCLGFVFMMQKEVALRVTASVGDADYSWFSVWMQSLWHIEKVTDAGPGDFWPPPKVSSRVLKARPKDRNWLSEAPIHGGEGSSPARLDSYLKFLKASFVSPRKTLYNNWKKTFSPDELEVLMSALSSWSQYASDSVRPHQLAVTDYQKLFLKTAGPARLNT